MSEPETAPAHKYKAAFDFKSWRKPIAPVSVPAADQPVPSPHPPPPAAAGQALVVIVSLDDDEVQQKGLGCSEFISLVARRSPPL
jgi:hypothetical protein